MTGAGAENDPSEEAMIIQCQACRTRFRLDESRIKGKGARIRCRRCGESIIVMKSEITPPVPPPRPAKPASPPEKEFFDLRAELREPDAPAPESPWQQAGPVVERPAIREAVVEPGIPPDADRPMPPEPGERDVFAPEHAEPTAPPPPPPPRAEEDVAEPLVHKDQEPGEIAPDAEALRPTPADPPAGIEHPPFRDREEEPATPVGADGPPPPPVLPEASFTLELEKEEDLSFLREEAVRSAPFPERSTREEFLVSPPAEGPEPERESAEYLVLDVDSGDTLRKEEPPAKFDISESLDHPAPTRAETLQDELTGLIRERLSAGIPVPEPQPPVIPPPKPLETEEKRVVRRKVPASKGRPSVALLVLLFVTLAGAGAYFAFTKPGQETLRIIVPGLESFWLGKDSGRRFLIENLTSHFESGGPAGRLFVIRGEVTNKSRKPRSAIRIRAELLDANRATIADQTAYAGNVFPDLLRTDRTEIDEAMANRFGDALSNVDVPPGKSLPFMVVFFDPPQGVTEYRLEAQGGE